jgi:hypothetical protein
MADPRKPVLGALKAIQTASKAADEELAVIEAAKAADRAAAGRRAADVAKATAPMKMSEALGNMNVEGKGRLKITQADRTRVGGGNIGGPMFSGLQQVDPLYEGAAWGVGKKSTASAMINQSDPNTLWTTVLGSADQLKTNPLVFNKLRKGFTDSMKQGNLSDELAGKINHNLALTFGEGADIRDPKIWRQANTFEKRAALADAMLGQGVPPSKGGVALGGEKSGKGVIFQPSEILRRETEPMLLHPEHGGDVPTFAVGPRLFTLSGDVKERPDLHPGFPIILQGEDKGVVFNPVAGLEAMPEFVKRHKEVKGRDPSSYFDWTMGIKGEGLPTQPITEEYLTYLQKKGKKEGGAVAHQETPEEMARFQKRFALHKATGGKVDIPRLSLKRADGGKIARGIMGALNKAAKAVDAEAAGAKTLTAAEREANKAKFLEPSAVKEKLFRGNRRAPKADKFVTTQDRATPSFTNDPEVANVYSQQLGWDIAHGPGSTSVPVYIQSEKPFDVRPLGEHITLDEIIDRMDHDFTVPRHPTKLGYEDLADILGTLDHHAQKGNAKQNIDAIDKRGTFRIRNFSQLADEISNAGSKKDIDRILYDLLPEASIDTYALADSHEMVNQLKKQGFDSMIHKDVFDAGMPYYKGNPSKIEEGFDSDYVIDAFRPFNQNKIKSAIGNRGTYDVTDPDITKAKGGAVGHESLEELERFHKRFALHKATGGKVDIPHLSLKRVKKFDGGGVAAQSPEETVTPLGDTEKSRNAKIAEKLYEMAKAQGKEEVESLKKPRAITDLLNRGVLANNPVSAGVDLLNMGLGGIDTAINAMRSPTMGELVTGKQDKKYLSSEKPFLGSEHMKELMDKYGVTSGEERPLMETALSLVSPTAVIKGAQKTADVAKKAPEMVKRATDAFTSSKLSPLATEAKTASAGKPTGATYATKQEGPFFRVRPTSPDASAAKGRGVREADELQGTTTLGGEAGSTGSPVPTRLSDEEVARIIADPAANEPLNIAKKYTQETQGSEFTLPQIPESSLVKQSAIGRTHQLAVEGTPEYKSAVFDAYAREMPEVLEQSGAKNYDDLMEKAYRQLAKETDDQFRALPYNFSYHRAGEGNYVSSKEMAADVHGNKHLYVFQGGDPHDFLNRIDPVTGLNENEKFRAVHDLLGHAIYGNQFGPKGEETAWAIHSQMYSPLARLAMTSETRGQNSMVNYSPLNAALKAEIAKYDDLANEARRRGDKALLNEINAAKRQAYSGFQYAPQKAVLLPPEFLSPQYAGGMPSYLEAANRPAKGTETQSVLTHFSHSPELQFVDPKRYGTGIKGAEAERLRDFPGGVRDRSYFYMGEPGAVSPEPGLGVNRYRGEASSLYDITQDPLNFRVLARESNRTPYTAKYNQGITSPLQEANDMERLVKEYGYQGMANPKASKPMAIMFKETPVRREARGGLTLMK